jgi:hypothetical protein
MQEERRTLFECIYSGKLNGEVFFDESREMNYHVSEVYGDPFTTGVVLVTYENGKSKVFNDFFKHMNDLEVIAATTTQQVA